jgi:hypothetical protein
VTDTLTIQDTVDSPLAGRLIFILSPADGGGELVAEALGAFRGVAVCGASHLFDEGLAALHANHAMGDGRDGFARLADAPTFLRLLRRLGDDLLGPSLGTADLLVEYTPAHMHSLPTIRAAYPDARLLHVTRDVRASVAAQGASLLRPTHAIAVAREWAAGHRAVLDAQVGYRLRVEDLAGDPGPSVRALASSLGIDPGGDGADSAIAAVRRFDPAGPRDPGRLIAALADRTAGSLLPELGYRR